MGKKRINDKIPEKKKKKKKKKIIAVAFTSTVTEVNFIRIFCFLYHWWLIKCRF